MLFDVAATISSKVSRFDLEIPKKSNFFYGVDSYRDPLIYGKKELSGVVSIQESDKPTTIPYLKDLRDSRNSLISQEVTKEEVADIQKEINKAREDAKLLAKKTLEKVWGNKN